MKECQACRHCFPDQFNNCPTDGGELISSIAGDTVLDGRYQLDLRIGQGGMGIVYKARHIFLKTSCAIKIILPDLVGNDPMLVTRFRQEAMVAARIGHRNIVNVTDFGVVSGKMPYLVMDLIKGRSLHDLLKAEGRLAAGPTLEIMTALCAGVGAAHRQRIVHRDLKPLNVMIQDGVPISDAVKVLDFGLAKIKAGELLGSFVAAQTTGLMGSPHYMAPELWSDEEPDARTDIYSLGVILFQMLAGDVPFKGPSLPSIMKKHLSDQPPHFLQRGVNVSQDIEAVVHRSLAKKRDDRIGSVEEFIHELRVAVESANASMARISMEVTRDFRFDETAHPGGTDAATISQSSFGNISWETKTRTDSQQRIEDEADRLTREFEEAQRRADEARLRAEEASRKRAEEEAARRKAEEEAARKLAEEEAARQQAEEMARQREEEALARRLAEEEAARKLAEDEERQRREEEEARKRVAEEAARLAREIVEAKERAEEARLIAESEARKRSEEEVARKRAEEEAQRLLLEVAEAQRRAEEARTRAENEARKRAEDEEARRAAEEEQDRLQEIESLRIQAEGEEARQRAAEDADRLAREISEAQQRAEDAGSRAEEEARKRAEAEEARARAEEEARKLALQMEELQRRAEESRKRSEEEAAQRAQVEEQRRRDEGARERAEEESRKLALQMEEMQRRAEESRKRSEEEAAKRAELEKQRQRDAEVRQEREAQEAAAREAQRIQDLSVSPNSSGANISASSLKPDAADAGESISELTLFESRHPVPESQASWKQSQPLFEASKPGASTGRRYTTPIILAIVAVVFVALILGAAALYSGKWFDAKTPTTPPKASPESPVSPSTETVIKIDGGTFSMGLNDVRTTDPYDLNQYPARSVDVATFWMDKTEVTNAEYADFIKATGHAAPSYWSNGKPPSGQDQLPVTNVSLADAKAFADWRSGRDRRKYRLPTEEEWEYAARNGSQSSFYPWGNAWLDGYANLDSKALKTVGSFPKGASARWGVLDLIGNVWEWTSSSAGLYPGNDRMNKPPAQSFVIRGGGYPDPSTGPSAVTATRRFFFPSTSTDTMVGFRLVREEP